MRRILIGVTIAAVYIALAGGSLAQAPSTVSHKPAQAKHRVKEKALVLPNVAVLARELQQTSDRQTVSRQLVKSRQVLAFWDSHRWLLAPRKEKCWQVPWQRSCTVARASQRLHAVLAAVAERRLDETDPTIARLNKGLSGTPMEGLGRMLRDIGRQHNVSPFFIAAAAGTESSFGAAGCGNNPRNVWGLAACDGRWYVPYFDSWDEAITFYAKFIAGRWPSATSPYHFYGYAACDACWGRKTAYWMSSRFGVSAYTKYPT